LADIAPTIRAALAMKSNDEQSSGMPLSELFHEADPGTRIASSSPLP
jgi:hypothetical protein